MDMSKAPPVVVPTGSQRDSPQLVRAETQPLTPDTGTHRPPATTFGARSGPLGRLRSVRMAYNGADPAVSIVAAEAQTRYSSATTRNVANHPNSPQEMNGAHSSLRGVISPGACRAGLDGVQA